MTIGRHSATPAGASWSADTRAAGSAGLWGDAIRVSGPPAAATGEPPTGAARGAGAEGRRICATATSYTARTAIGQGGSHRQGEARDHGRGEERQTQGRGTGRVVTRAISNGNRARHLIS